MEQQALGIPRPDDLAAGIRASLSSTVAVEQIKDEEEELYKHESLLQHKQQNTTQYVIMLLDNQSPLYTEPLPRITTTLYPHQLAGLYEMSKREIQGSVSFTTTLPNTIGDSVLYSSSRHSIGTIDKRYTIHTNVGILGDIPGYGKTLTIIALMSLKHEIHNKLSGGYNLGKTGVCTTEINNKTPTNTNMLICPNRLVKHWCKEIETKSTLKYLVYNPSIKNMHIAHKLTLQDLNGVDIVITTPNSFFQHNPNITWKRIIIDEADTIRLPTLHIELSYAFIWLITGSHDNLLRPHKGGWIHMKLLHEFHTKPDVSSKLELLNRLIVKNSNEFIKESVSTPNYSEERIVCKTPGLISASREFISAEVAEMLAAGDIEQAIVALGGRSGSQDTVIDLIRFNTCKELRNEEREIEYVTKLELDATNKANRLKRCEERILHLRERLKEIEKSIEQITEADCKICYTTLEAPTMVMCCKTLFCGKCLIAWFNQWNHNTCPMCRQVIRLETGVITVTVQEFTNGREVTKLEALRLICTHRQKVLVFANHQNTLNTIRDALQTVQINAEIFMGQNTNCLKRFKDGKLPVLILDPRSTAGIDITEADVVVLYHRMDAGLERQAIGRAQRLGRTAQLDVYRLMYTVEV